MDLTREILLRVEKHRPDDPNAKPLHELRLADFPKRFQSIGENQYIRLRNSLFKEGLLEPCLCDDRTFADLTWKGHDYLDEIRDPVWFEKLKKRLDPQQPYTLEYIRKVSKPMKEAASRMLAIWLATAANWIGFSVLAFIAWFFGVIRFL